jgi:hypothetical protein
MKAIAILIMALFLTGGMYAQKNEKSEKKEENKKESREVKDSAVYAKISFMIDSMDFVLEADYLHDKYGNRVPVTSGLNFIMVDSSRAVIQTGRNSGIGYNGVGGVTVEGSISNWKVQRNNKKQSFSVSMDVMSNTGIYNIFMDISGSGRATATLSGLGPGQLTWEGYLTPIEQTRTFEGRSF